MIFRYLCQAWQSVLVGANANNSGKAGVFALNANNSVTNDNATISGQLCLLQPKPWRKYPGTSQNTKQTSLRIGILGEDSEAK